MRKKLRCGKNPERYIPGKYAIKLFSKNEKELENLITGSENIQ